MRYAYRSRLARPSLRDVVASFALLACASTASAASWISNGSCVEAVYTVPPAITRLHVTALGAAGEDGTSDLANGHSGNGGRGGYGTKMVASVNVTPGQALYVGVADPYNGIAPLNAAFGGAPGVGVNIGPTNIAGAGGSATFISLNDPRAGGGCDPLGANLLLVAAGGGGGGGAASYANGGNGGTETQGAGNGAPGGANRQDDGAGGGGATVAGGGVGGNGGSSPTCISGTPGASGDTLQGGRGGNGGSSPGGTAGCQPATAKAGTGAGGGGGYFGGGGGGGGSDNSGAFAAAGGGGGAGLSYRSSAVTLNQPLSRACLGVGCSLVDEPIVSIVPFDTPPVITSANTLTLTAGTNLIDVTLTAAGWPVPELSISNLPAGVFQQSLGGGQLALTGVPGFYAGGVRVATLTAGNTDSAGVYHATTQAVTITVNAQPAFTNPSASASFEVGVPGTFDVVSNYGWPIPALTILGTLPPGLSLVDEGDGSGRITGTPTQGGIYDVTLRASNGVGTAPTQALRLRVTPIPQTIVVGSTQNPSQPGQAVSFTAQLQPIPECDTYIRFDVDGVQFGNYLLTNGAGFTQTSQVTSLASGPHTIAATSTGGCGYAPGTGQATQVVSVVSGPASGTTLAVSPATFGVFVASGRVYDATLGGLDTGIPSSGLGGIAIDASGNTFTFAPELGSVRLRRTAPDGTFAFIGPSGFTRGAYGMAVDGAGNAFAAERDRITRVTPGGGSAFVASNPGYNIRQVAADSAGNVFFSNYVGSYAEVLQVTPPYTAEPTLVATGFGQVGGIAADSANNLFVSDPVAGKVYRYSLVNGQRTTILPGTSVDALAIDAAGTLYLGIGDAVSKLAAPYTGAPVLVWQGYPAAGIATRPFASAPFGQTITLKATTISAPAGAFPAGTVTFRDGATPLGTVALNASGVATLTSSSLVVATHALSATYNGGAGFPASTGTASLVVTQPPVPVTVTGIRVRGSPNVAFSYTVGTLPPGVTAVTGTLTGCASSTSPGASIGTYQNTIYGCAGLSLAGPNAANYSVQYVDGGVTLTPQPLPIVVAGRLVVATSGVTFTWTTPITLPSGTTIAGTLAGCTSTVNAATPLGLYNGTISGCTGLSVTGPAAADFALAYVDGGVEVVPLSISVTVTATKPFGGGVVPTFSYVPQPTFPAGVTGVAGTLTGCTSTVVPTTPPGVYNGTIGGCGGLSAQGPQAAAYSISYVDGGITVTERGVAVNVFGFQLPGGTPLFRYSVTGGFPRDIYSANGPISGCTTTVTAATPPGNYAGTISGCGGLIVFTDTGVEYAITYVDAGFTVGTGSTSTHIAPTTGTDPELLVASAGPRHLILHPPPYTQAPVLLSALVASGAAFDSSGNLVSSDIEGLRIYDPAGNLRRVVTTGIFLSPIALDSNDNVFGVVLENNVRASIWRIDWPYTGTPSLVKAGFGGVSTIMFDSSDRLWIGDQFGRFPTVLEPPYTGAPLIVVQPPLSSAGFTVDGEGSFFNGRNSNGPLVPARVDKFVPPYTDPPLNFTGDIASSNFGPRLVADRQGNLFGGDSLGLLRIPASGGTPTRLSNDVEFRGPIGLAQSSPPARAAVGSPVSVTITVASLAGGTPTGTVRVFEGATQVGSGTLVGGKATISIPGLAEGTHFLTASYLGAAPYAASSSNKLRAVIGRDSPTLLFTTPPSLANGASASVSAVATSGLGATYSGSGACSVAPDGTVTGTAAGTCTITATAPGNGTFLPALPTTITLPVAKGSQAIAFGAAPTVRVGASGSVAATVTSGLAATFASSDSTCAVTPAGLVTGLSVGPCTVTATQPGNADFEPASPATQVVTILQGTQAIAFDAAPAVAVGTSAIVTASGGGSFNVVTFSTSSPACTVATTGLVTGLHAGSCVVNAAQAGNTNWLPATGSTTIAVARGSQAITFGAAPGVVVGGSGNVSATTTSGLAASFSSTSATCTVTSSGTVAGVHGGPCVVTANQPGDADWFPAPAASQTIIVGPATQAIVFGAPPSVVVGGTGNLSATGGASGNPVTYSTSSTTCTVTPTGTVTGIATGACVVVASQAASPDYAAATATQSLAIARGTQTITFGTAPSVAVLGTGTVTATTNANLPVAFSSASPTCIVTPAGAVTGVTAGSCIVDAAQPGDVNWNAATPASQLVPISLVVLPTDLAISIDDGTGGSHVLQDGQPIDYTIVAANLGANTARNATVADVVPAGLANASWTCETPPAGTCTQGGPGNLASLATIPPGGDIVFHVVATVQQQPELIVNTATIATGPTESDSAPANNSATVATRVVVFANGFEGVGTTAPAVFATNGDAPRADAATVEWSALDATRVPQLAATIVDRASGRSAQVFVRQHDERWQARVSWRDEAGRWQPRDWFALPSRAPLALAWTTERTARGVALAALEVAQGDAVLERSRLP